MKRLFFIVLVILSNHLVAQKWKLELSYKYLYGNIWDKAIQTYNFSRPFLDNKQPLLKNGANFGLSRSFKTNKKIISAVALSYSYFRSKVANENFTNELNLNLLNIGYKAHYDWLTEQRGFFSELELSALASGLFRRINGTALVYDDAKTKALGIGIEINFKGGYQLTPCDGIMLAPFIAIGYSPFNYAPKTESVINQTTGLTYNYSNFILSAQAGVCYKISKRVKK